MIKQLITDLAYDNITLSQALTRAKIIATKIKNDTFRKWLNKELEGYDYNDPTLPPYRKIYCNANFLFESHRGISKSAIILNSDNKELNDMVMCHQALGSIALIESTIQSLGTSNGVINLSPEVSQDIFNLFASKDENLEFYRGQFVGVSQSLPIQSYQNIIELTKQKLLDTLLELDSEFPQMENDYTMSKDDVNKAQHIVTNNIYGGNNPLNIASGHNVTQNITSEFNVEGYEMLRKLGVEDERVNELKDIVNKTPDKPQMKDKVMKWLGSVSSSMAAKGLYENIPEITKYISNLL